MRGMRDDKKPKRYVNNANVEMNSTQKRKTQQGQWVKQRTQPKCPGNATFKLPQTPTKTLTRVIKTLGQRITEAKGEIINTNVYA
jgi:hypothetical protein